MCCEYAFSHLSVFAVNIFGKVEQEPVENFGFASVACMPGFKPGSHCRTLDLGGARDGLELSMGLLLYVSFTVDNQNRNTDLLEAHSMDTPGDVSGNGGITTVGLV